MLYGNKFKDSRPRRLVNKNFLFHTIWCKQKYTVDDTSLYRDELCLGHYETSKYTLHFIGAYTITFYTTRCYIEIYPALKSH